MLQLQVVLLPFLDLFSDEKDYNKKLCLTICPDKSHHPLVYHHFLKE